MQASASHICLTVFRATALQKCGSYSAYAVLPWPQQPEFGHTPSVLIILAAAAAAGLHFMHFLEISSSAPHET